MPIGGRSISQFIQKTQHERGEGVPSAIQYAVAKTVKERYCQLCPNLVKEYQRYDETPDFWIKTYEFIEPVFGKQVKIDVGYEVRHLS